MNIYEPDGEGLDGDHETPPLEKQIEEVEQSRKTSFRIQIGLFLALMIALLALVVSVWFGWQWLQEKGEAESVAVAEQVEKKEIAQEAQEALCGTGDREIYDRDICERLAEAAEQPAPPADEVTQTEIVQAFREYCEAGNCRGANGRTPTAEEVAAAFSRFCADGKCRGPAGEDADPPVNGQDGADGQNATPEMVLAAVTEYCADGRCVGAAGANGEPGPPPSAEAIQAAVNAFCANGACVGAQGPPGADSTVPGPAGPAGATGAQGVSIADVDCIGEGQDSTWQITLSNGQILNGGGPCKTTPLGPPIEIGAP